MFSCVFSLPYVQLVFGALPSTFSDQKSLLHYSFPQRSLPDFSERQNQSITSRFVPTPRFAHSC